MDNVNIKPELRKCQDCNRMLPNDESNFYFKDDDTCTDCWIKLIEEHEGEVLE